MAKVIQSEKGEIKLPCFDVVLVDIDKVVANDYNPNHVSVKNMQLLEESILSNGFCFPVVTIYDEKKDEYIIIDGFHRYTIFKDYLKAKQLPVVVLDHDLSKRMIATVQFNRARGVHHVELMGDLVKTLAGDGITDEQIAVSLGMEMEEVYRLKQITGVAELFKNQLYSPAWEMKDMDKNVYYQGD